jgi:peptidoglycan/xylan/chitin deacetylase (PgdA/CDA1 family)
MQLAFRRFEEIFGAAAKSWAAAGWQTNVHAARLQQRLGLEFASDTRGNRPFLPAWNGEQAGAPQLPTTLPTLDELIGVSSDAQRDLLERTARVRPGHVFTAHAELEGGKLASLFESLIKGWQAQGYEMVTLGALYRSLDALPRHGVIYGEVPGRSGRLALQGEEMRA